MICYGTRPPKNLGRYLVCRSIHRFEMISLIASTYCLLIVFSNFQPPRDTDKVLWVRICRIRQFSECTSSIDLYELILLPTYRIFFDAVRLSQVSNMKIGESADSWRIGFRSEHALRSDYRQILEGDITDS